MKVPSWVFFILCFLVVGLTYFLIDSFLENETLEKIYKQNELARDSLMKKILIDSTTFYHKYASVQSELTEKEKLLKKRDEIILAMSTKEILFKNIIDSLTGTIVVMGEDTRGIPYGSILEFKKKNEFYWSIDSVYIEQPPWIKKKLGFAKFRQKDFLTRDKEGRWSGYTKFEPEIINQHLVVTDLEIIVERDDFVRIESDIDKFRLSLMPSFGLLQKENSLLGAGLKALINKKYLVEVTKGIANDWLWIGYSYNIDIIK